MKRRKNPQPEGWGLTSAASVRFGLVAGTEVAVRVVSARWCVAVVPAGAHGLLAALAHEVIHRIDRNGVLLRVAGHSLMPWLGVTMPVSLPTTRVVVVA
jgi:hypothetical protein